MSRTTTKTARDRGFGDFVAPELVREPIRRDKERAERKAFDRLRAELAHAFAAPESTYRPLTGAEVIARNRAEASAPIAASQSA